METSYFAVYKKPNGISIALSTPRWFTGPRYPALNPTWDMLAKYNLTRDNQNNTDAEREYTESYERDILAHLDPEQVLFDFEGKVALCFETSDKFCHRHCVRNWILRTTGVIVPEVSIIRRVK